MPTRLVRLPLRRGFSLIEILVVIAIVAIISAVAMPTYQASMRKSRRSDGYSALANIVQAQERWRANNATYFDGDLTGLLGGSNASVSPGGHYSLAIVANSSSGSGYAVTATAREGSPQVDDSACRVLQITIANGNTTYSSKTSAGVTNSSSADPCWVK